ncbi:RusA family crossover junction endodeoxyribonuclease [Methylobacterium sp. E-045]|uniref:RusA family crossover junction endodeoxyribonuclease n=1 Tax=Methylobacterium sp. E-045 TaxID=2836575 RepID=UPI001FB99DD3|nr:RusA family crossover junction endodeoxyribonuclease [Methylobacterium sp. E-045]MCJ2129200.1 RusA family crossover junction endodeoxyribonuclease [Methylobacterium sp. E-045]
MSEQIVITLPGEPRGKGRHRARVVAPRGGKKPFVQEYPDPETARYEAALRTAAAVVMVGRLPLSGPLVVVVYAFMPIPTNWSQAKKREARNGLIRPVVKPDWDNIGKICDALNEVVWGDDSTVVDGIVRKFYSDNPELVITVEPWVPAIATLGASALALDEAA